MVTATASNALQGNSKAWCNKLQSKSTSCTTMYLQYRVQCNGFTNRNTRQLHCSARYCKQSTKHNALGGNASAMQGTPMKRICKARYCKESNTTNGK